MDRAWRSRPVSGAIVPRGELFRRLAGAGRVTVVSAPAGSGKTSLLRFWIAEAELAERVGWVSVQRAEHDPQRFWISVLDALRDTSAGSAVVRASTLTADLDGRAIVQRLLEGISSLEDPLWLVIDDLQELRSAKALSQLASLLLGAAPELRFVLSARCDLRLGLHRLRLEGAVTELRADDLRFSLEEARALFQTVGVPLPDRALARLHERTEGWCAGLRMAALSLAGGPDPERFAAEFGGSERTVTEYLLAEVLERQPKELRRLLLRTSVLERVNGPLADLLTGRSGGERALQGLEEAGAFVVSLDTGRTWFRYHHLFADLLQLELRRTEPAQLTALHDAAAVWFAEHGYPVEAIRHAQAAERWSLAARLLSDHWLALRMAGQGATAHALLAGFPDDVVAADAELPVLVAADELMRGSLAEAERQLARATRRSASVPAKRRMGLKARLAVQRLGVARRGTDLPAFLEEARRLLAPAEARESAQLGLGEESRAVALAYLAIAELWTGRLADGLDELIAARHTLAARTRALMLQALLLEAIARDALGDAGATGRALKRALDSTEPDDVLWPFLFHRAPELLERHARHGTTHMSLISEIPPGEPEPLPEPLSESETRVLRYLPTNLSAPEIAGELCVAVCTVKTHIHHIYGKLGVHRRAEAVERARAVGLLARSSLKSG